MLAAFTMLLDRPVHIGNNPNHFDPLYLISPQYVQFDFVGDRFEFPFTLPSVDTNRSGSLMFESFAVRSRSNRLWINPDDADDQINRQPYFPNNVHVLIDDDSDEYVWAGHVLTIRPGVLRAGENLLRIEAGRIEQGVMHGDLDNFVVDNIVLLYETTP